MPAQSKIDMLEKVSASLEASAGLFVIDYRGLTVKETQELRRGLREAGAHMKVYKKLNKIEFRGGITDGQVVSAEEVIAIADLPSKEQLLGQIAGLINGFARDIAVCVNGVSSGLARSIQQVSEQKAA